MRCGACVNTCVSLRGCMSAQTTYNKVQRLPQHTSLCLSLRPSDIIDSSGMPAEYKNKDRHLIVDLDLSISSRNVNCLSEHLVCVLASADTRQSAMRLTRLSRLGKDVREDSLASPMTIPYSSGSVVAGIHHSKLSNQVYDIISNPNSEKSAFGATGGCLLWSLRGVRCVGAWKCA